jgi:hypothetical protein
MLMGEGFAFFRWTEHWESWAPYMPREVFWRLLLEDWRKNLPGMRR